MTLIPRTFRALQRWRRTPATIAIALMTAMAVAAVVAAQSSPLDTPSPAHGSTQVISQGMTSRPALASTWRVVERDIPMRADARPSDRLEGSAGFILADADPIFVTDQDTKLRYRLASGEALYVPIGANQTWASLADEPTTAYTLELAVRDNVDEAGRGEVLYKSGTFGMAEGDYDLDLLRNVLPNNEHNEIDKTDFPILIFVTDGQVEVKSDKKGVKTTRLDKGEAAAFEGNLDIRARSKGDATFVAAVVGASIGGGRTSTKPTAEPTEAPTETPTPEAVTKPTKTPTPEETKKSEKTATPEATKKPKKTPTPTKVPESRTGSAVVHLDIRLCPRGMRPETLDASKCKRANGGYNLWLDTPYGDTLRLRDANKLKDDYIRWDDLKAGTYILLVRQIPKGYDISSLDGYLCCRASDGYSLTLSRGTNVRGTLYFFRPDSSGSSSSSASQTAPVGPDNGADSDGDGVSDKQELDYFGTSPQYTDSDGDSIPDGVEAYGTNGYLTSPSLADTDGDGVNDDVEIKAGTNPTNGNDHP
jgi:hypothetical protein